MWITLVFNVQASDQPNDAEIQVESEAEAIIERSGWYFSGGLMNFDSEVSFNEGVEDSSFYLNFGYEGHSWALAYSVGMSGLLMSDDESFSQRVVDNFGNVSTASSSADAFGFYGEVGYRYAFDDESNSFDVMLGAEFINGSRGIASCIDCRSEDINIDSGLYIKPRFRFYNESGLIFSIDYHQYLSGDIENGFSLNFSWAN